MDRTGSTLHQDRSRFRRLLRIAVICAIVATALFVCFVACVFWGTCATPDYYEQSLKIDPAIERQASDEMLEETAQLVSDVQQPGQWEAVFTQEQVNGWLAVDLEENHAPSIPKGVEDPRVFLGEGSITLACQVDNDVLNGVVSVEADVYVPEPGQLAVRLRSIHLGKVPLPQKYLIDHAESAAQRLGYPVHWAQQDGDAVLLLTIEDDPNEQTSYQLEAVVIEEGRIGLAGTTIRQGRR